MMAGNIILINGTSSSGKTSIVHTLQGLLSEPYLEAGLDKFIWMLPRRYLDRPLWDDVLGLADHAGSYGHSLVYGMHTAIAALSKAGIHVIADHVLVEPAWVEDCVEMFSGLPAYLIGVNCPLDVLEERERARKDRTLGQARLQFPIIHKFTLYDLEVDTSLTTPEVCARAICDRISEPPAAFKRLRDK